MARMRGIVIAKLHLRINLTVGQEAGIFWEDAMMIRTYMKKFLALGAMAAWAGASFTQERQDSSGGTVSGKVHDLSRKAPLEHANVVLYRAADSAAVTGAVTDAEGGFQLRNLPSGKYYLGIHFIGYRSIKSAAFEITPSRHAHDAGVLALEPATLSMAGVTVEGERAAISYQIDKKVINVSRQHTALSGTAADVLENVPSITVDIEGNVSLRGSGNFTVLIDGRPTILEASEALQQIPASNIEDIEIITNPSAKYNPEGAAGIINIVMKKSRQHGRSAMINANVGLNDKYGGDVLMEHKTPRYHTTLGFDNHKHFFSGNEKETNQTTHEGLSSLIQSQGGSLRGRTMTGVRGELRLTLHPQNILALGGRYRERDRESSGTLNYAEWAPAEQPSLYTSISRRGRSGENYEINLSYRRLFDEKGHELFGEFTLEKGEDYEETVNERLDQALLPVSGQRATEFGPEKEFEARLEYLLPLSKESKFEAGYQSEFDHSLEHTGLHEYDPGANGYVPLPQYSNATRYQRDEHALYALYATVWNKIGFQGGLRGEHTHRLIEFQQQQFKLSEWDYFPTFHASYEFAAGTEFMASYTRRIERPGGGQLEPFETWIDAYSVHVGNPALKPEYIDAYETGIQTLFGKSLFSMEAYYRVNHNKIEEVRSVYDQNVTRYSAANVGTDHALGSELLLDLGLFRNWDINLMGNVYQYRITGALEGEAFSRRSFNWSGRWNNTVKIGKTAQVQINGRYNSATVSSQGRRNDFFVVDLALRRDFFKDRLSATLQLRDVLDTGREEFVAQGPDFYSHRHVTREAPVLMLNLKFSYNQQKKESKREPGENDNEDGEF